MVTPVSSQCLDTVLCDAVPNLDKSVFWGRSDFVPGAEEAHIGDCIRVSSQTVKTAFLCNVPDNNLIFLASWCKKRSISAQNKINKQNKYCYFYNWVSDKDSAFLICF